jgi:hypothetical protein
LQNLKFFNEKKSSFGKQRKCKLGWALPMVAQAVGREAGEKADLSLIVVIIAYCLLTDLAKYTHWKFHAYEMFKLRKSIDTETRLGLPGAGSGGEMGKLEW